MYSDERELSYGMAINEAIHGLMEKDPTVLLMGQGVKSPWYVGCTAMGLIEKFGEDRVMDTPISENAMTGAAVGASIAGMKGIIVHPRMDFMFYALDPIMNQAANWSYMNGGRSSVPVVFWGIINRGGEQAAQHSQALQSLFAHMPGLKVVAPSTPYDAKGLMISAINDCNPVVFIDDRWLYDVVGNVPEDIYEVPIGSGERRKVGNDLTIISSSYLALKSFEVAHELENLGISTEFIDLRSLKPLDKGIIKKSVKKTGRVVVVDGSWQSYGISAEISAVIMEECFEYLKCPVKRIALMDSPAPASSKLENCYYLDKEKILESILALDWISVNKK